MNKILMLCLLLLLAGCITTPTQTVVLSDGREYAAEVTSGTLMELTLEDGTRILIDRKGRPSVVEDLAKIYAIQVINKD